MWQAGSREEQPAAASSSPHFAAMFANLSRVDGAHTSCIVLWLGSSQGHCRNIQGPALGHYTGTSLSGQLRAGLPVGVTVQPCAGQKLTSQSPRCCPLDLSDKNTSTGVGHPACSQAGTRTSSTLAALLEYATAPVVAGYPCPHPSSVPGPNKLDFTVGLELAGFPYENSSSSNQMALAPLLARLWPVPSSLRAARAQFQGLARQAGFQVLLEHSRIPRLCNGTQPLTLTVGPTPSRAAELSEKCWCITELPCHAQGHGLLQHISRGYAVVSKCSLTTHSSHSDPCCRPLPGETLPALSDLPEKVHRA